MNFLRLPNGSPGGMSTTSLHHNEGGGVICKINQYCLVRFTVHQLYLHLHSDPYRPVSELLLDLGSD
jgi:hypothetical protein